MTSQADVVVIGSGGLGAALAFHLVKGGVKRVALVDKRDIGSQTSPRAAGMVSCVRKSELMISLIKLAAERLKSFTEDTGQPWTGSTRAASRSRAAGRTRM
jgi:glycine/D-amino acid oxidase-like deaminating enzyme